MINIALIGTGTMGKNYIRHIKEHRVPSMNLTAAVARSEANQKIIKELCGDSTEVFASESELYEHADLFDAVLIATPHRLHPEMARNAFRHGKHVLLDKPIGISVGDCQDLAETACRENLKFSVVFHQRAYDKFRYIKNLLDNGTIGSVYRILMENSRYLRTEHYHKSSPWRSSWNGEGGGALINQGQHLLDMWQWLFGMPEELVAQIGFGKYNDFAVDDEASIVMRYPGQKSGIFILTTGEGTYSDKLEITGSRGTILLEEKTLKVRIFSRDLDEYRKTAECNSREELEEKEEIIVFDGSETTHQFILENFAQAVEGKESLIVDGASAMNALELTNAAYLSAWLNKPIELPINPDVYERELRYRQEMERKTEE